MNCLYREAFSHAGDYDLLECKVVGEEVLHPERGRFAVVRSRREPRVRGSPRGSPRVSPRNSPSRAMWSSPHGGGRARPVQSRSSPLSTRTSPLQVLVPLGDTD